jgi:pimeloyl-ACP methyl ester carboxylesterase
MKRLALNVMRDVAEHLAQAGIVSFRYDKRGVGQSSGDYRSTGFHDNAADAAAAVEALRGRPEVDPNRVFVVGHSEGALIASELAARQDGVVGAVLLSGAAQPGEAVLRWQGRQVAGSLPGPVKWLLKLLRKDFVRIQDKRISRLKQSKGDVIRMQLIRINAKWFREFLAYDPAEALRRAKVPILAITGSKDIQVDPSDVARMAELVPTDFVGEVPEDVTHLLRRDGGPASLKTYKKQAKRPVDGSLLETVSAWIEALNRKMGADHEAI